MADLTRNLPTQESETKHQTDAEYDELNTRLSRHLVRAGSLALLQIGGLAIIGLVVFKLGAASNLSPLQIFTISLLVLSALIQLWRVVRLVVVREQLRNTRSDAR